MWAAEPGTLLDRFVWLFACLFVCVSVLREAIRFQSTTHSTMTVFVPRAGFWGILDVAGPQGQSLIETSHLSSHRSSQLSSHLFSHLSPKLDPSLISHPTSTSQPHSSRSSGSFTPALMHFSSHLLSHLSCFHFLRCFFFFVSLSFCCFLSFSWVLPEASSPDEMKRIKKAGGIAGPSALAFFFSQTSCTSHTPKLQFTNKLHFTSLYLTSLHFT